MPEKNQTPTFQGKKAEYNKLVLKALISGGKTTTEIANYIYFNRKVAIPATKLNKTEVKKIVSIISRKSGRLEELEKKKYVKKEGKKWISTTKGHTIALTFFDNLNDVLRLMFDEEASKQTRNMLNGIASGFPFIADELEDVIGFASSPNAIGLMRDTANTLIQQGTNIDKMSDEEFTFLISSQLALSLATQEIFKKKRESQKNIRAPKINRKVKRSMKKYLKEK